MSGLDFGTRVAKSCVNFKAYPHNGQICLHEDSHSSLGKNLSTHSQYTSHQTSLGSLHLFFSLADT